MNTLKNQIMRYTFIKLSVLALLSFLAGCSSLKTGEDGNWVGFTESGKASFYGDKHQNKKTASGARYKHALKTAAHKKLPFGSSVKVTNVDNGKSVIVKINDRGPFVRGRIIDLSKSAFSSIGNTSSGLIDVKIEVIK
ncbi:septal ring lytic transglycosylase RlpA family protein [Shewanella glacialipiscicola]|uniref:septal ring lytic transglycosylase RlpA family protein n=1 Tax=Shewanella glacialipiscicola TaxID=614069 RepID=UPI003D7A2400